MNKYRFSIFTAMYNRASMLELLAEMINNQTFNGEYEWVIVNDGSTDNTVELNKLFRMHLLPSLVPLKKLVMLYNYINYESHRDKQLFTLKNKFDK